MDYGIMDLLQNTMEVYDHLCRPIWEEAGIQRGELRVLLFLANNPGRNTAVDIQKHGGMKPGLISMLVEKLVQAGLLERQPIPGDRRKVRLVYTEKAEPIIEAGRNAQKKLLQISLDGVSPEDIEAFNRVRDHITQNILDCKEKMRSGSPD